MSPFTIAFNARPAVALCGRRVDSFRVFGLAGASLATLAAIALARATGLSGIVALGLAASGLLAFVALALATRWLTGVEQLVYYHQAGAMLLAAAALLWLAGLPVLPYLDLEVLWLGIFLACGRGGCLMAGCCHGRPQRWGVRYTREHAAMGFPDCYVGVPLFPVQALESMVALSLAGLGAWLFVQGRPPGTVLASCIVAYALARIWLEELRGDDARGYWLHLSEAQWTSLLLAGAVAAFEARGYMPHQAWHDAAAVAAALSMAGIACTRGRALGLPRHSAEIARILVLPQHAGPGAQVCVTSLAVRISCQHIDDCGDPDTRLVCLSHQHRRLDAREAGAIARMTQLLCVPGAGQVRILRGGHGVFHLIVRPARRQGEGGV